MKAAFFGLMFMIIFFISTISTIASANTAEVHGARLNLQNSTIEVQISYSACDNHVFDVRVQSCTRSKPASCVAEVVDMTAADSCREFITETVEIPTMAVIEDRQIGQLTIIGSQESAAQIDLSSQIF
jgi:hypothetical protein